MLAEFTLAVKKTKLDRRLMECKLPYCGNKDLIKVRNKKVEGETKYQEESWENKSGRFILEI